MVARRFCYQAANTLTGLDCVDCVDCVDWDCALVDSASGSDLHSGRYTQGFARLRAATHCATLRETMRLALCCG